MRIVGDSTVVEALGGEGVDAARLAAILWPDASGDAARVSFDATLYRTRRLLGLDAALALAEGKLSLDRRYCRVDVNAFERTVRAADAVAADAGASPEALVRAARTVADAYPGHFLAGDEDHPWLIGLRDRLRSKLARTALALGRRLHAAGHVRDACALYQRVLELDNLAEDLYRQLMVGQRDLGERAAALQTCRRCRELLSAVLGVKPSPETEAVRRSLDEAAQAGGPPPAATAAGAAPRGRRGPRRAPACRSRAASSPRAGRAGR